MIDCMESINDLAFHDNLSLHEKRLDEVQAHKSHNI